MLPVYTHDGSMSDIPRCASTYEEFVVFPVKLHRKVVSGFGWMDSPSIFLEVAYNKFYQWLIQYFTVEPLGTSLSEYHKKAYRMCHLLCNWVVCPWYNSSNRSDCSSGRQWKHNHSVGPAQRPALFNLLLSLSS